MKRTLAIAIVSIGLAALFVLSGAVSAGGGARISGAIFTSLEDGAMVNANHYADKRDVYLNGGPGPNAPSTAAGLPDGNYYFQVTDPSGKNLLSSDPVKCREFRAANGRIAEYVSEGRSYKVGANMVPCWIDGWEYGKHDYGFDAGRGSVTIQLMPYDDTTNRGGVYKVWATPISQFVGDPDKVDSKCTNGCFHGFIPAYSKTDNFKVKTGGGHFESPTITVKKFNDLNGNGVWDANEPEIGVTEFIDGGGWPVTVEDPNGVIADGYTPYLYYAGMKGQYLVSEEYLSGWSQTVAIVDGVSKGAQQQVAVNVAYTSGETHTVIFGNFKCFTVDGYKYNDLNGNGARDDGEPTVPGWSVQLWKDGQLVGTVVTDENGYYSFSVCSGGSYVVKEIVATGWTATGPESYSFDGVSGYSRSFDFLNFEWFEVCGYKYNDLNGDGIHDQIEPAISGWTIYLYKGDNLVATTTTDSNGKYCFTVKDPGSYKVVEETVSGWQPTYPVGGQHTFTAVSGHDETFDFLNFEEGSICGHKWYDLNMNGQFDSGDSYIAGFKVELYKDGQLYATEYTDENGEYCFYHLLWGTYTVNEVTPSNPDQYHIWAQTYPSDGSWTVIMTSGLEKTDADFGNVAVYTGGLTWGYWKTHTGYDAPPRDPAYDLLESNAMPVDVSTPDGNYYVNDDSEAKWVFSGAGSGNSPNCSGDCRSLFRAQLLALHMNLLKFGDMGDQVYFYEGDQYSGWTVGDIYNAALGLLNDGQYHDFTSFQQTLDRINNSGEGTHYLVLASPPEVVY